MKTLFFIPVVVFLSCKKEPDKEMLKAEIMSAEKAFEAMAAENGIAEAFYFYAADSAVIKRQNDTLIQGKENIKLYYSQQDLSHASVKWTPDYIDVSDCGTMGYTYGKYTWVYAIPDSTPKEFRGVFHTVWKKQTDGNWKYVWD